MQRILDRAMELFREAGIREVYPSFDAVPLPKKSDRRFTVLGLESVQLDSPFPDGRGGVHPFAATLRVSVLIPMNAPASEAENFFFNTVLPLLQRLGAVLCQTASPVVDIKLQRLVVSGTFRLKGLYLEDASDEPLQEVNP